MHRNKLRLRALSPSHSILRHRLLVHQLQPKPQQSTHPLPDPYLRFTHRCHSGGERYKEFTVSLGKAWQPELTEVGDVDLDDRGRWVDT